MYLPYRSFLRSLTTLGLIAATATASQFVFDAGQFDPMDPLYTGHMPGYAARGQAFESGDVPFTEWNAELEGSFTEAHSDLNHYINTDGLALPDAFSSFMSQAGPQGTANGDPGTFTSFHVAHQALGQVNGAENKFYNLFGALKSNTPFHISTTTPMAEVDIKIHFSMTAKGFLQDGGFASQGWNTYIVDIDAATPTVAHSISGFYVVDAQNGLFDSSFMENGGSLAESPQFSSGTSMQDPSMFHLDFEREMTVTPGSTYALTMQSDLGVDTSGLGTSYWDTFDTVVVAFSSENPAVRFELVPVPETSSSRMAIVTLCFAAYFAKPSRARRIWTWADRSLC